MLRYLEALAGQTFRLSLALRKIVPVNRSPHHKTDAPEERDILQGIARDGDEIGEFSGFNAADAIVSSDDLGVQTRRGHDPGGDQYAQAVTDGEFSPNSLRARSPAASVPKPMGTWPPSARLKPANMTLFIFRLRSISERPGYYF